MALTGLIPYLNFNGTASDAIALYERALGAKVVFLQRFGDTPEMGATEDVANHVMHATLSVGGNTLMISDAMPGSPVGPGNNTHVCLQYDGIDDVDGHFAALSEGARVLMPLENTFWGARFGMLVDKFDINWMFNAELPK
jgi:PhnB protein